MNALVGLDQFGLQEFQLQAYRTQFRAQQEVRVGKSQAVIHRDRAGSLQ